MGKIVIAETFVSLQGEGATQGAPSIFIRLGGCNLMCGGKGTEKDGKLHDGATWRCDTIEVWRKGRSTTVENFIELLDAKYEIFKKLKKGWHLVITGGEPLMQQDAIIELLSKLGTNLRNCVVEIETNGTIIPKQGLIDLVDIFNVSPKLSTSGMKHHEAVMEKTCFEAFNQKTAIFKFVIGVEKEITELEDYYGYIDNHKIYLMPAASNVEQLNSGLVWLSKICIDKGYNLSNRMQVQIWNETTGV